MEFKVSRRKSLVTVATALLLCAQPALAENSCAVGYKPQLSGFRLNPVLDKLVVMSVKPTTPKDTCVLQLADEIMQVNQQRVPGSRALTVMKYWKAIPDGTAVTYRIKRANSIVTVLSK